ncbi:MAG TPA: hypothetical protein VFI91_02285 [Longimicrobiaceae bacterium]|nr:hypothetical protein [Longimicrobiaceae bacterium]
MLYLMIALGLYVWTMTTILRADAPRTHREVVGAVLTCTLIAAAWPLVLSWRVLLGRAI